MNNMNTLTVRAKILLAFSLMALLAAVAGLSGLGMVRYVGSEGLYKIEHLAPLGDAAMEIKLTATEAHLIFEEIMAGDVEEDVNAVWALLDETRFYANAILNGGENDEGTFYASEDPVVQESIAKVLSNLDEFIRVAKERHATLGSDQGVGSGADEKFDALYDTLVTQAQAIANKAEHQDDAGLQKDIGKVAYHLAHGHLLVAEILGGDAGEDFGEATGSFEDARAAMERVAQQLGADAVGDIPTGISELIDLANQRYKTAQDTAGAGSEFDVIFDVAFDQLIQAADAAEEAVHDSLDAGVASLRQTTSNSTVFLALVVAAAIVIAILLVRMSGKMVTARIQALAATMQEVANDRLDVTIPNLEDPDEIGQMADTVEVFRKNLLRSRELQAETDRQQRTELERAQSLRQYTQSFEADALSMTEEVNRAAQLLETTAESLNGIASNASGRADAVASVTDQTSSNLESVASSSAELSGSITEIARQMGHANQLTEDTRGEAENTQREVNALEEAAQRIGDVVHLISEIAEQTNLLALNATIEAARAGDAGKGFSVVANEVKTLAGQTANATREIAEQIQTVQYRTQSAVTAISGIVARIAEVREVASAVATAVEQQESATREITMNVEQASQLAASATQNVRSVQDSARDTDSASGDVLETARGLLEQSGSLRNRVNSFVEQVRAT